MSEQIIGGHATTSAKPLSHLSEQYTLALRGENLNPIIDAATPLLGMVLRIQDLASPVADPAHLYRQVVTDIEAIEQQLEQQGYEPGITVTFRYVLCTFIDECVMSTNQTLAQVWSNKSLLIHFHNEGWGGEKVYVVLERLMSEPKRYKDLLEFFYLCFCLGFRGRYKVQSANTDEFDKLLRRLHNQLLTLKGEPGSTVLHQGKPQKSSYSLPSMITIKHVLFGGLAILAAMYCIYLLLLDAQSKDILSQLNMLLK